MNPNRPRFSAYPGFTLIELLTVLAIIGILAAIIIPTVGRVREQARIAQCQSNVRQIGVALNLWATDNKGYYPPNGNDGAVLGRNFAEKLIVNGYMSKNSGVFACPSDRGVTQNRIPADKEARSYSYISPAMAPLHNGSYNSGIARRQTSITNPSRVAMLTESHTRIDPDELHVIESYDGSVVGYPSTTVIAALRSAHRDAKHHFLFFDGHVAVYSPVQFIHTTGNEFTAELWGFNNPHN